MYKRTINTKVTREFCSISANYRMSDCNKLFSFRKARNDLLETETAKTDKCSIIFFRKTYKKGNLTFETGEKQSLC